MLCCECGSMCACVCAELPRSDVCSGGLRISDDEEVQD